MEEGEKAEMAMGSMSIFFAITTIAGLLSPSEASDSRQSYVVYLGGHYRDVKINEMDVVSSHHELLASVLGSKEAAKESIFYSYTKTINGFAARLEQEHAQALSKLPGVLSVFPDWVKQLHTTRSWEFLGLENGNGSGSIPPQSLWQKSKFGADVIIGNLDTGVWPESASFNDRGLGPIPSRWKGTCEKGDSFGPANCNRKLIGARYFIKGYEAHNGPLNVSATGEYLSPRDKDGHGTHTLSTAGGGFVKNANFLGLATGTAKGGSPNARVAAYKVCWSFPDGGSGCYAADILAAFDAAIQDGVDVFSISLGSAPPLPNLFADVTAIGAYHAVQSGRVVICSAGNAGPESGTVCNVAPWIITVGASSIDREFYSSVLLGNNKTYQGVTLSADQLPERFYPLVSSLDAKAPDANDTAGQLCFPEALDPQKVKGKIVACLRGGIDRVQKGDAVSMAGGIGMILCNAPENGDELSADPHYLPAAQLSAADGQAVFDYINKTESPVAYISPPKTILNTKPAPEMTSGSSRGPNSIIPDILKPDITAPGLNILASYSPAATATDSPYDKGHVKFNIKAGTSMACPHVAGIVASLRAVHPDWSPTAIKSAIMTTAYPLDNAKGPIKNASRRQAGPLDYGAGHVDPNAAADPGLLYDYPSENFYLYLCNLHYNSSEIKTITGKDLSCPSQTPLAYDLNYPSITVSNLIGSVLVQRSVTNVGNATSTYKAKVKPPPGVAVTIDPAVLSFSKIGQQAVFTVKLDARVDSSGKSGNGWLTWSDGSHSVTSPIVVNAWRHHRREA